MRLNRCLSPFVPAKAGTQGPQARSRASSTRYALDVAKFWVPASAGTNGEYEKMLE
jgi:hypothetical protein